MGFLLYILFVVGSFQDFCFSLHSGCVTFVQFPEMILVQTRWFSTFTFPCSFKVLGRSVKFLLQLRIVSLLLHPLKHWCYWIYKANKINVFIRTISVSSRRQREIFGRR